MIWFEIVLELVGKGLDFLWKFVGNLSNTSLDNVLLPSKCPNVTEVVF